MITDQRELFEVHVASILDHPSAYMGGPPQHSRRKAKAIADFIADGGTWATPDLTAEESELHRNSDRAYVEAMVKAAYEDAAKIIDKRLAGWRKRAEHSLTGTAMSEAFIVELEMLAAAIRSRIVEPVDEGSGCVFCDLDIDRTKITTTSVSRGVEVIFVHPTRRGDKPCTNRTTGAKSG